MGSRSRRHSTEESIKIYELRNAEIHVERKGRRLDGNGNGNGCTKGLDTVLVVVVVRDRLSKPQRLITSRHVFLSFFLSWEHLDSLSLGTLSVGKSVFVFALVGGSGYLWHLI